MGALSGTWSFLLSDTAPLCHEAASAQAARVYSVHLTLGRSGGSPGVRAAVRCTQLQGKLLRALLQ